MDNLNEQFGKIYDEYISKIYRFVYLKVNSQEIAEDITSKVFIRGWEAFSGYARSREARQDNEIKNPGAFLYQIARNAVVDHYRDKGRAKVVSVDASLEIVDPGESAQNKAILSADINAIKKGIKVPLHGGGKVIKSYIHIRDVYDATLKVARGGKTGEVYPVYLRALS